MSTSDSRLSFSQYFSHVVCFPHNLGTLTGNPLLPGERKYDSSSLTNITSLDAFEVETVRSSESPLSTVLLSFSGEKYRSISPFYINKALLLQTLPGNTPESTP